MYSLEHWLKLSLLDSVRMAGEHRRHSSVRTKSDQHQIFPSKNSAIDQSTCYLLGSPLPYHWCSLALCRGRAPSPSGWDGREVIYCDAQTSLSKQQWQILIPIALCRLILAAARGSAAAILIRWCLCHGQGHCCFAWLSEADPLRYQQRSGGHYSWAQKQQQGKSSSRKHCRLPQVPVWPQDHGSSSSLPSRSSNGELGRVPKA